MAGRIDGFRSITRLHEYQHVAAAMYFGSSVQPGFVPIGTMSAVLRDGILRPPFTVFYLVSQNWGPHVPPVRYVSFVSFIQ